MLTASLPMYEFTELHAAMQSLWRGIAKHLRKEGIDEVPDELLLGYSLSDLWSREDLLFSQCCGYDVVRRYRNILIPLAAPVFAVSQCSGHQYSSLIVVPEDSRYANVLNMRGTVVAANGPESHSGTNALMSMVAPKSDNGRFFRKTIYSGAHVESLRLLREKKADVAAVDCVTFKLLETYRPAAVVGVKVIGQTKHAPAPPYVSHVARGKENLDRIRAALFEAFENPDHEAERSALLIRAISPVDVNSYEIIERLEMQSRELGYHQLD